MTIQTTKVVKELKDKPQTTLKITTPKYPTLSISSNSSQDTDDVSLTTLVLQSFDEAITETDELSSTVKELKSATQSQTSGIEEVSASIQSISTAIQGVATNATKVMDMMRQSEQITQNISVDAAKGMEKIGQHENHCFRVCHRC